MNFIENELKCLRQEYGEKMSPSKRMKLEKYSSIIKEIAKHPFLKKADEDPENLLPSIREEIFHLRKSIESDLKMAFTDYEAFLWKNNRKQQSPFPDSFSHLDIKANKIATVEDAVINLNFPILSTKVKDLCVFAGKIISENFFCMDNFQEKTINNLIYTIAENYNILSYHNFSHAFSVFLMLFQCQKNSIELEKNFTSFDFFIAYISALSHDMNHKGTNSMYQIKKKSELALKYNNQSVLQNMHISQFYRMLREKPEIDIISNMKSPTQRERGKRLINKLILATDVQLHGKKLTQFKNVMQKYNEPKSQLSLLENDVLLENLFHACDIGNPCLEFKNYMNWAILLGYEFDMQSKLEEKEELQITTFFQYKDMETFYRSQINFINFLAFPLWQQITFKWPQLKHLKINMEQNKQKLKELLDGQ